MNMAVYDRDVEYWNNYYSANSAPKDCSLFAHYVYENYLKYKHGRLIDLGCGNGRDSKYFIDKSIVVTGIDASSKAIEVLNGEHIGESDTSRFVCGDFVTYDDGVKYRYCYSRFSLHAISSVQENQLLNNIRSILEPEGYFFIEVRSVNDELYGKGAFVEEDTYIYDNHFRRFIRIERLISKMVDNGFFIDYAAERKDFAPYGKDNPIVIRVVGRKK